MISLMYFGVKKQCPDKQGIVDTRLCNANSPPRLI
jgi:hypothetical protein